MNYREGEIVPIYDYSLWCTLDQEPTVYRRQSFGKVMVDERNRNSLYIKPICYSSKIFLGQPYCYDVDIDDDEENDADLCVSITCQTTDPDYMEGFKRFCFRVLCESLIGQKKEKKKQGGNKNE